MIKNCKDIHNSEADLGVSGRNPPGKSCPENCCPEKCPRKVAHSENLQSTLNTSFYSCK